MGKRSKVKRRLKKAIKKARKFENIDTFATNISIPQGAILADHNELKHNNTYEPLPRFYVDKIVICRDCSTEEIWSAQRQKWWYEVAKGSIFSQAELCRTCREKEKARKELARHVHQEGIKRKK